MSIKITQGDITKIQADAIVNPANETLLGGGGCDGMIHYGAGHELREECKNLGGCEKGQAKITKGYALPAKYNIHTVDPIALPAIATGAFHFPKDQAAEIAIRIAKKYEKDFEEIIFVCFMEIDYNIYREAIKL